MFTSDQIPCDVFPVPLSSFVHCRTHVSVAVYRVNFYIYFRNGTGKITGNNNYCDIVLLVRLSCCYIVEWEIADRDLSFQPLIIGHTHTHTHTHTHQQNSVNGEVATADTVIGHNELVCHTVHRHELNPSLLSTMTINVENLQSVYQCCSSLLLFPIYPHPLSPFHHHPPTKCSKPDPYSAVLGVLHQQHAERGSGDSGHRSVAPTGMLADPIGSHGAGTWPRYVRKNAINSLLAVTWCQVRYKKPAFSKYRSDETRFRREWLATTKTVFMVWKWW